MYAAGDYIVYGMSGVCLVCDVCKSPFSSDDPKSYYVLHPMKEKQGLTIYSPVDNASVTMRRLMDREQTESFLQDIPKLEILEVPLEKNRREIYRAALSSTDPVLSMRLLKTVFSRRATFAELKRRLPETDLEFEEMAMESLYREISIVLDIPFSDVSSYISKHLNDG